MWSCAGSAALAGTESCVLASDIPRPAVDAEELQRLRISCPAEVGALHGPDPRQQMCHIRLCACAESAFMPLHWHILCAYLGSPTLFLGGKRLIIDPSLVSPLERGLLW